MDFAKEGQKRQKTSAMHMHDVSCLLLEVQQLLQATTARDLLAEGGENAPYA